MNKIYAVAKGRETGVFESWSDCEQQVKGYPGAKFKAFMGNQRDAAMAYIGIEQEGVFSALPENTYVLYAHIQECTLAFYNKALGAKGINDVGGFVAFYCNEDKVGSYKYNKRIESQNEAHAFAIYRALEYGVSLTNHREFTIYSPAPTNFNANSKNKKIGNWSKKIKKLARDHDVKVDVRQANKNNPASYFFNGGAWR